ncbi:MAG TPA: DUF6687 family protein [Pyrinomonadaceae bacterium]|nr:DUF6687 family protein [Pyrinomonadaceae bacterium]
MRFQYYSDAIANLPKLSVDGTVDNAIHFSHWNGNKTPPSVKADTSTEIALNVIAAPNREELTQGIDLVTNNHFDTDGVLSVWAMLNGERALPLREKLIAAAAAGDFCEFSSVDAVRASIIIQGSDSPIDKSGSPLAQKFAGDDFNDESRNYDLVLPKVGHVLTHTSFYESLWREPWRRIELALASFAGGESRVDEDFLNRISLVTLAPAIFEPSGFDPSRHSAPFTAIAHHARGNLFVIATPLGDGWAYRVDYPYYSWAETVVRPRVPRHDFSSAVATLNDFETSESGHWEIDTSELASAIKFLDRNSQLAASKLAPDLVTRTLADALTGNLSADAHHA